MTQQIERTATTTHHIRTTSLAFVFVLCANLVEASVAFADRDSPQFHSGACKGAYAGWLRGVVDGYHDLSGSPVENPSSVLLRIPTPAVLSPGDERLGFGDGLQEGFKLGVDYGVELGRGARTTDVDSEKMAQLTAQFQAYVRTHCITPATALDWDQTFMNDRGTSTVTSLNEAQVAMHAAVSANQMAVAAEESARYAHEAEARGDRSAVQAFRESARFHARTSADFAQLARNQAAAGREEAVQPIMDAEAAAERAKKAADSIGR